MTNKIKNNNYRKSKRTIVQIVDTEMYDCAFFEQKKSVQKLFLFFYCVQYFVYSIIRTSFKGTLKRSRNYTKFIRFQNVLR